MSVNGGKVHSFVFLFLIAIFILAAIVIAFNSNKREPITYKSSATGNCAAPGSCQTVHTSCCPPGTVSRYESSCGSIPVRCAILPTATRAPTRTPTPRSGRCSDGTPVGQYCNGGTGSRCIPYINNTFICRGPTPTPLPCDFLNLGECRTDCNGSCSRCSNGRYSCNPRPPVTCRSVGGSCVEDTPVACLGGSIRSQAQADCQAGRGNNSICCVSGGRGGGGLTNPFLQTNGTACTYSTTCQSSCCIRNNTTRQFECGTGCSVGLGLSQTTLTQAEMRALLGQRCNRLLAGNIFRGTVIDDAGNRNTCSLRCNSSSGQVQLESCIRLPVIPANQNVCTENCGGLACRNGLCSVTPNSTCSQNLEIRPNSGSVNTYLQCRNGRWQPFYQDTRIQFDNSCPNSYRNSLLSTLSNVQDTLYPSNRNLNVNCRDLVQGCSSADLNTCIVNPGLYDGDTGTLNINCGNPAGCTGVIYHELGHLYALSRYGSGENPDFNRQFNCTTTAGRENNCAETWADYVNSYITDANNLSNTSPDVYNWIKTNVFNGREYR